MSGTRLALRAIIFDAGGVLLHPSLDWLSAELAELGVARTRDELHHDYYRMIYSADLDGSADPRGMALTTIDVRVGMVKRMLTGVVAAPRIDVVASSLGRRAAERFPGEGDLWHWAMPGLRDALQLLRVAGFRLGVASNNDGSLEGQLAAVGVTDLFSVRLDSRIEGVAKPDPELLRRAASRLGVAPDECLYVGDIDRVDGAAARAAGMAFALVDPLFQPRPTRPRCLASLGDILDQFVAMQ
ncbi:MAG: HAD-IA family hydrolase [Deltaproteobacteria bacterium]|nr:HAD-IA family hydrolase [Deltaproteobacteria bacterium]